MMYDRLIVSLLVAFVFGNGTTVLVEPTPELVDLADRVLKEENWPELWFHAIADGKDFIFVSSLLGESHEYGMEKELQMIPVMIGCEYGLRLNWFFSAAVHAIVQCKSLSEDDQQFLTNPSSSHGESRLTRKCWNKTNEVLRECLNTMTAVQNPLKLILGDDIDTTTMDLNETEETLKQINKGRFKVDKFDTALNLVRNFITEKKADSPGMSELLNSAAFILDSFLISHCLPYYTPFDHLEVYNSCPDDSTFSTINDLFVNRMKHNLEYIKKHLTELGFPKQRGRKKTTSTDDSQPDHTQTEPTPELVDLANRVLKHENWAGLWFHFITDGNDYIPVSSLLGACSVYETAKKLEMIPVMIGCAYGLRLNWFFSAAVYAIRQCEFLSQNGQQNRQCWDQTDEVLQRGLPTMTAVQNSLKHILDDDIDTTTMNLNETQEILEQINQGQFKVDKFDTALNLVRNLIGENGADSPGMSELSNDAAFFLDSFLISRCLPKYTPFDPMEEFNNYVDYTFHTKMNDMFVKQMNHNLEYISKHLTNLEFPL